MLQNWNLDTFKEGVVPFISHSWHIKLEYKQKGLKGPYFFGMGVNSLESMIIPDSLKSLQKDAQVVFLAIVRKFEFFPLVSLLVKFSAYCFCMWIFLQIVQRIWNQHTNCAIFKNPFTEFVENFFDVRLILFANLKA